ncbi:MAG: Gfo/Idh/MocA family protein [Armatimonadota bacterium]
MIPVAVVGYGGAFNMGRQHLREMRAAGMEPTAVCDLDRERLKVARQEFPGIKTYTRLSDMLRRTDVQLVTVITPHDTHADLALRCLKAGRSVVIEKPMTITTVQCNRLIDESRRQGVLLSTYHNRHWDGHILEALDHIGAGEIGDVYRIECHMGGFAQPGTWWRSNRKVSGGILYDWGVHLLEYALQILHPSELVEVSGYAKTGFWANTLPFPEDANEDEAQLTARFADGRWLSLNVSQLDHHSKGDRGVLEISGTRGTYIMNFDRWSIRNRDGDALTVREGRNRPGEGHKFYENIAGALAGTAELVITPEWARRPVHILDLAVRSAAEGRAQTARHH